MNGKSQKNASSDFHLNVCDTEFYPMREAFPSFREAVAGAFMPWRAERDSDSHFGARLATFSTDVGFFGHIRMSPVTGFRNQAELSNSPDRFLYANYVLRGQLFIEQGDVVTNASKGDLVIFDSTLPAKHIKVGDGVFEDLSFSLSKKNFRNPDQIFRNVAIPHGKILPPLLDCFAFLANDILTACPEELMAIASACASLLPVAIACGGDRPRYNIALNQFDRRMLRFIDNHIADATLSPSAAAQQLGVSVRYVHMRFAAFGTSFTNHIRAKRLEFIRRDLVSEGTKRPIHGIAYRWGFSDLSTFIRAFKKEFGCTPREYRARHRHSHT